MSSYWSGCTDAGMVLTQVEFDDMLKIYVKKNPRDAKLIEQLKEQEIDLTDMRFIKSVNVGEQSQKTNVFYIQECSHVDMKNFRLTPFYIGDGKMNIQEQKPNGDWTGITTCYPMHNPDASGGYTNCYVIECDKYLLSPKIFEEKPYDSYQAFVQEFKDKLEVYLPEDFCWNMHLGTISYAIFT